MQEFEERAWQSFPLGLPQTGRPRLTHIMHAVVLHTGVSADDIKSKRKTGNIIYARHLYCYFARSMTDNSLSQVGQSIGFRDHTTVLNSVERINKWLVEGKAGLSEDMSRIRSLVIYFAGGHT